jgi:hypothetical protein
MEKSRQTYSNYDLYITIAIHLGSFILAPMQISWIA